MALRVARACSRCSVLLPVCRRLHCSVRLATEPLPAPTSAGGVKVYPPKIELLVKDISNLTLLETSQLNELLKVTLKIVDAPLVMGAMSAGTAAPPSQPAAAQPEVEQKTSFTVKLVKYGEESKVKVIKEIKAMIEGMNLVQAKKFVESVPQVVQKDISKEEAAKLKTILEAAGGVVSIE